MRKWRVFVLFWVGVAFGVSGCHSTSDEPSQTAEKVRHYVYLDEPLIRSRILLFLPHQKEPFYQTLTSERGSFFLPENLPSSLDSLKIVARGGEGTLSHHPFHGELCAIVKVSTLDRPITISLLSTLGCLIQETQLDAEAEAGTVTKLKERIFTESESENLYRFLPDSLKKLPYRDIRFYDHLVHFSSYLQNPHKARHWLALDDDDDGLSNQKELLAVTDPEKQDSDGDGLKDGWEIAHGLDPTRPDTDGDDVTDGEEWYKVGTDPLNPDSDFDFIPDGRELHAGRDPLDGDENRNGLPDGFDHDPFYPYQWYLESTGEVVCNTNHVATVAGNDLGIKPVYRRTWGEGVIIQVVDSGVETSHEDLSVDLEHSWNVVTHTPDPSPTRRHSYDPVTTFYNGHGTAVAGIIGAMPNNGKGIRGVAPGAKIAAANWLERESIETLDTLWFSAPYADEIAITNNSWGGRFVDDPAYEEILRAGATRLRNGKGRIYVFASGNDRKEHGNANLSYLTNNPYVITVAALNHQNRVASYSTPGSNVLISAYGGEHFYTAPTIMSTFLSGESMSEEELEGRKGPITIAEDTHRNYTFAMNGTSAAAPIVSAEIALVLSACPELGYRDVKKLLARSAKRIDDESSGWIVNGAGLHFHEDYGFGLVNAEKMIDMCRSKSFRPLPPQTSLAVNKKIAPTPIPELQEPLRFYFPVSKELIVEWVGLTVTVDHPYAGDLRIDLISPSGTKIPIIRPNFLNFNAYKEGFRFGCVGFMEERSDGVWQVEIRDMLPGDQGVLQQLELKILGHTS